MTRTMSLLQISKASHDDIRQRIESLGAEYARDYLTNHSQHGVVIAFGEVGMVIDKNQIETVRAEAEMPWPGKGGGAY